MNKNDVSYLFTVLLCGCAPAIGGVLLATSGGGSGGSTGGGPTLALEEAASFPPAMSVAAGDIDGDRDVDLVFGLAGGNVGSGMWTFENVTSGQIFYTGAAPGGSVFYTGDGGGPDFVPASQYGTSNSVEDLFLVDVDGDGDLDLVVHTPAPDGQVWLNDGRGAFTDSGQSFVPPGQSAFRRLAVADLDGDRDPDVVTVDQLSGGESRVNSWLNDGTGVFTVDSTLLQAGVPAFITLGDVDGDGDQDLLQDSFGRVEVQRNDGQGRFTAAGGEVPLLDGYEPLQVFLGDIDRDGDVDVIGHTPAAAWYSLSEGDGITFAVPVLFTPPLRGGLSGTQAAAFGDLDRNGSADLVMTLGSGLQAMLDVGDPAFAVGYYHRPLDTISLEASPRMILVDLDRDGDRDLVVATIDNTLSGHRSRLYRNRGLR